MCGVYHVHRNYHWYVIFTTYVWDYPNILESYLQVITLPITRIKLIIKFIKFVKFIINLLINNTNYWCTSRQPFSWAEPHWLDTWLKLGAIQKWCSSYSHYSITICRISFIDKTVPIPSPALWIYIYSYSLSFILVQNIIFIAQKLYAPSVLKLPRITRHLNNMEYLHFRTKKKL